MTLDEASALQERITAAGGWVMWFVSVQADRVPGKAVAWAMVADRGGGQQEGGELVADTLDELRTMLPPGLTRRDRTALLPREVVETWD